MIGLIVALPAALCDRQRLGPSVKRSFFWYISKSVGVATCSTTHYMHVLGEYGIFQMDGLRPNREPRVVLRILDATSIQGCDLTQGSDALQRPQLAPRGRSIVEHP